MADAKIRERLRELLSSQPLGVLATHHGGQPYCSLMAFVSADDLKSLVFATTRATRKYRNISEDERAAMMIDNRSNIEADFHEAIAATATGTVRELKGKERNAHLKLYLGKHPHLQEFANSPTCALLKMAVDTYYVVSRFQEVVEIHIKQ